MLPAQGPVYGSRASPDATSMIVFRPLESWAPNPEWSMSLPEGEDVVALAAGRGFLAAATSRRILRLFATTGGQPLRCARCLSKSCEHDGLYSVMPISLVELQAHGACPVAWWASR